MALGLGNSASGNNTSISIVNNTNGVSVLLLSYYANGAFATTTSITDASGNTWSLRRRTKFQSPWAGAGSTANANYITQEIWWTNDPVSHNRALTLNTSGSFVQIQWMFQCMTGSTTPTAPWDPSTSANIAVQTFGNAATTTAAITKGITTSQANSEVLAFLTEVTSTTAPTDASTGSGMTAVNNQTDGVSPNKFHLFLQRKTQATAGAVTASATNNKQSFIFSVDTFSGTSTGTAAEAIPIVQTHSGNGVATSAVTYSADAGDIIVLGIGAHSHTNYCKVRSVTDQDGLTWHRRRQDRQTYAYTSNSSDRSILEYWWAYTSVARSSRTITITFDTTSNLDYSQAFWATFSGVANVSKPWAAAAAGFSQKFNNAGSTQLMTPSVTSSATGDMLIGFAASLTKSPGSVPTVGTGGTAIGAGYTSTGTAQGVGGVSNTAPSVNTFQWNWNNAQNGYIAFGDALGITGGGAGDDSDLTAIPSVTSTDTLSPGNTFPSTATYSALADELLIIEINTDATGGYVPVTSIGDGTLTFTRRGATQLRALQSLGSTQNEYTAVEVWWAHTPVAFTNRTLTINYDTSASSAHGNPIIYVHHVADSQDPTKPFDDNASAHGIHTYAHASVKETSPSAAYTTSQVNDLILSWSFEYESTGSGAISTVGSGQSSITTQTRGLTPSRAYYTAQRKTQAVAGASTAARVDATGKLHWILVSDAISGTMTGSGSDTSAVSASATGATVTATTSISTSGAANVSEEATTLTVTTSIISGTASSVTTTNGATLTVTTSLIAGVVIVDDTADGVTLTDTVSLIDGSASVNNDASGDTLTLTTSVTSGSATVDDTADGDTLDLTFTFSVSGVDIVTDGGELIITMATVVSGHVDLDVDGVTFTEVLTISEEGQAGAGNAQGKLLTILTELIPGSVVSGAQGLGQTLPVTVSLIDGTAFAVGTDASVSGSVVTVVVSLIDGQATSETDAQADGDTLILQTILIDGAAEGTQNEAGGQTLTVATTLIPGAADGGFTRVVGGSPFVSVPIPPVINAFANGALFEYRAYLDGGTVQIRDEVRVVEVIKEVPALSQIVPVSQVHIVGVQATGSAVVQQIMFEAGLATGDAIAYGQLVTGDWDYGPMNEIAMGVVV